MKLLIHGFGILSYNNPQQIAKKDCTQFSLQYDEIQFLGPKTLIRNFKPNTKMNDNTIPIQSTSDNILRLNPRPYILTT